MGKKKKKGKASRAGNDARGYPQGAVVAAPSPAPASAAATPTIQPPTPATTTTKEVVVHTTKTFHDSNADASQTTTTTKRATEAATTTTTTTINTDEDGGVDDAPNGSHSSNNTNNNTNNNNNNSSGAARRRRGESEREQILEDLLERLRSVHDQLLLSSSSSSSSTNNPQQEHLAASDDDNEPPDNSTTNNSNSKNYYLSQARRWTRAGNLLDRLAGWGFAPEHAEAAVLGLGRIPSLSASGDGDSELWDWLCLHLETAQLPPLFTERRTAATTDPNHPCGAAAAAESSSADAGLTVIRPSGARLAAAGRGGGGVDSSTASDEAALLFPEQNGEGAGTTFQQGKDDDADEDAQAAQKAWLLSQYAYDDDDDEEENDNFYGEDDAAKELVEVGAIQTNPAATPPAHSAETNATPQPQSAAVKEEAAAAAAAAAPTPERVRLDEMRLELAELEADLRNDANNYMRGKCEIKELQKQVKILKQRVSGLERKVARQEREAAAAAAAAAADKQKQQVLGTAAAAAADSPPTIVAEDDEDYGGDLFSTADNTAEASSATMLAAAASSDAPMPATVEIPEIPANWTGKTPKEILEEHCRKENLAKPVYQKLALNGCRVRVRLGKSRDNAIEADLEGPTDSYKNAQHYASVKLLYVMNETLPLYRLFPPFYRDLWLSWLDDRRKQKQEHDDVLDEERRRKIERLLQCASEGAAAVTRSLGSSLAVRKRQNNQQTLVASAISSSWYTEDNDASLSTQILAKVETASGRRLRDQFRKRQETAKYREMLAERTKLPIRAFQGEILETVKNHPVTILCAETGSGKTTQCSSYILEQALSNGLGDHTSILCTQPRRVAAMSVAERVADELAEPAIGKLVGYQIRMEARRTAETRLLFCTTGVVLRRLIDDPTLKGISHVVVDEVHERQWQVDVLLVSLRSLREGRRKDLKIILMSATLDTELFSNFFGRAPVINVPGRTFPVSVYYLEDILEQTNHLIEEGSRCARRDFSDRETVSLWVTGRGGEKRRETADYQMNEDVSDDYPDYSMATRKSMDRVDETVLNYDLIEDILASLLGDGSCPFKPPEGRAGPLHGAVLIFLPGIGEIRALMERLSGSRYFGNSNRFEIVPMHSTLSSSDQRRAFKPSPEGCRKIIISTNIAETSITIPDVVYVIDCGRVREIQRDKRTATRKLVSTWCSRANAKQRAGRAGRVQPGVCLKLYSSRTETNVMRSASEPELRRIPLEEVCLTILAGSFAESSCKNFLLQTPQPPSDDSIRAALQVLEDIGAIVSGNSSGDPGSSSTEVLTSLGQHLAKLPVDARVGKMLIFGAIFKCTDAILTIAACLSASKSPFASTFENETHAKAAHAKFSHPHSDFITLINVWTAYKEAGSKSRKFCRDMFLNFSALSEIKDARVHYLELLCSLGFIDRQKLGDDPRKRSFDEASLVSGGYCQNSRVDEVLHAVICAGLFPNVAKLIQNKTGKEATVQHKNQTLSIRSSVNSKVDARQAPSEWLTYFEKFGTERRTAISKTAFVSPFCLMIFGSDITVLHTKRRVVVGGWIELPVAAKTGVIFREIRALFDSFLAGVIENSRSPAIQRVLDLVVDDVVKLIKQA